MKRPFRVRSLERANEVMTGGAKENPKEKGKRMEEAGQHCNCGQGIKVGQSLQGD